jgi:hypothetical protein
MIKTEKNTKWIFAGMIVLISLGYIFSSFGKINWVQYINVGLGILLGMFIFVEAGVLGYIKGKRWKSVSAEDLLVWFSFVVGAIIILNSVMIVNVIRNSSPMWLVNFLSISGAIFGGIAGLLAIAFIFVDKPKA